MAQEGRAAGPAGCAQRRCPDLGLVHAHRWLVLLIWFGSLVAVNVLAQTLGTNFSSSLSSGQFGVIQVQNILAAKLAFAGGSPARS